MRTMHSAGRRILQGVVLLVSAALLLLAFLPRVLGYTPSGVGDDSMAPLLHRGDLVLTQPVTWEQIQTGDLLTFADPKTGARFTRTVAEIWTQQQELVTVSAQSDEPDPYTTAYSCVIGRVARTIRFAGYPSVWLNTTLGKVILALLFILWIAVEIETISVSKRRDEPHA